MKQKPYHLLVSTSLLLALSTLPVSKHRNSIDIHLHDTYFIIAHAHILWVLAFFAFLVWAVYLVTNKFLLSKTLVWIHVLITTTSLLLLASTVLFGNSFTNPSTKRYMDFSNWNALDYLSTFTKAVGILLSVLLIAQIIFIMNFVGGMIKKLRNRRTPFP